MYQWLITFGKRVLNFIFGIPSKFCRLFCRSDRDSGIGKDNYKALGEDDDNDKRDSKEESVTGMKNGKVNSSFTPVKKEDLETENEPEQSPEDKQEKEIIEPTERTRGEGEAEAVKTGENEVPYSYQKLGDEEIQNVNDPLPTKKEEKEEQVVVTEQVSGIEQVPVQDQGTVNGNAEQIMSALETALETGSMESLEHEKLQDNLIEGNHHFDDNLVPPQHPNALESLKDLLDEESKENLNLEDESGINPNLGREQEQEQSEGTPDGWATAGGKKPKKKNKKGKATSKALSNSIVQEIVGIEGEENSSYMESSLVSLFLYRDTFHISEDEEESLPTPQQCDVQELLANCIIPSLRDKKHISNESRLMEKFKRDMSPFILEKRDQEIGPEEFMQVLYRDILLLSPFFVIGEERGYVFQTLTPPKSEGLMDVQSIIEHSFAEKDIKLDGVPSPGFIVKLPVIDEEHMILPNLELSLGNILKDGEGSNHKMQLVAVISAKDHHYTSFVRMNYPFDSKWVYLDSSKFPAVEVVESWSDASAENCTSSLVHFMFKHAYITIYIPKSK